MDIILHDKAYGHGERTCAFDANRIINCDLSSIPAKSAGKATKFAGEACVSFLMVNGFLITFRTDMKTGRDIMEAWQDRNTSVLRREFTVSCITQYFSFMEAVYNMVEDATSTHP